MRALYFKIGQNPRIVRIRIIANSNVNNPVNNDRDRPFFAGFINLLVGYKNFRPLVS